MDAALLKDIKFNCDVSDAQYWGFYSVCGLLMRYRDLYRSEIGLKPWSDIQRDDILAWINAKESKWPELEQEPFRHLTVNGYTYNPFDVASINKVLTKERLVYGAGYGMYLKPTFFLAELQSVREISGLIVYTSGLELVRDLFTTPGMLQERTIFLRLEPLMALLLYKHAELNTRHVSALDDAFTLYGLPHRQIIDSTFERRIAEMAERYAEILLAHEIAEATEEVPDWKNMLSLVAGDRQAEHFLRAIKDLVADTSLQGPYKKIIEKRDRGALGLTIALTEGYRKVLYPEIKEAYTSLSQSGNWLSVEHARNAGYARFRSLRDDIVGKYRLGVGKAELLGMIKEQLQHTDRKQ